MISLPADEKLPPPPPYEAHENHGSSYRLPTGIPPSSSSHSQSAGVSAAPPIELTRDAETLIQSYIPNEAQASAHPFSLPLPLCLPQTSLRAKWDSPFAKGYNESLSDLGILRETFLNFIDGLNLAIAASPPLRVVDITGKAIGYVPYHWAMISGPTTILEPSATQTGIHHVLPKTLTDRYLRAGNKRLFHPKGLSVRICTTLAMENLLRPHRHGGSPGEYSAGPSKLDKFGRAVGGALLNLPIPILGRVVRAVADKPPAPVAPLAGMSYDTLKNGALSRRLARTEGLALPLTIDHMPPPNLPIGVRETISSWGVQFPAERRQRQENEAWRETEERRRTLAAERMGFDLRLFSPGYDSSRRMRREYNREARRHMRKERRELRTGRRGGGLLSDILGPNLSPLERRVANADLLEYWADEKVLWVVVMSSENDTAIEGIERADETENEEQVDEKSWKMEMKNEREILEEDLDELDELEHLQHDQKQPQA